MIVGQIGWKRRGTHLGMVVREILRHVPHVERRDRAPVGKLIHYTDLPPIRKLSWLVATNP